MRRQNASAFRTLPTAALRQGDFTGTGAAIYDPATGNADGSGRQLFPNNRIPTNRLDPIALKMIALIPQPNLTTFPSQFAGASTFQAAGSLQTGIPAVALPPRDQGILNLPVTVGTQTFPEVWHFRSQ